MRSLSFIVYDWPSKIAVILAACTLIWLAVTTFVVPTDTPTVAEHHSVPADTHPRVVVCNSRFFKSPARPQQLTGDSPLVCPAIDATHSRTLTQLAQRGWRIVSTLPLPTDHGTRLRWQIVAQSR